MRPHALGRGRDRSRRGCPQVLVLAGRTAPRSRLLVGWVEKPVPARTQSSLDTSRRPWPMLGGVVVGQKLKLWRLSSQSMRVWGRVSARRTSMVGAGCAHVVSTSESLRLQLSALAASRHSRGRRCPVRAHERRSAMSPPAGNTVDGDGLAADELRRRRESGEQAAAATSSGSRGAAACAPRWWPRRRLRARHRLVGRGVDEAGAARRWPMHLTAVVDGEGSW